MGKNILIVVTSVNKLNPMASSSNKEAKETGFNITDMAYLHERLLKVYPNIKWTIASPQGSAAPVDPASAKQKENNPTLEDTMRNESMQKAIKETKPLSSINPASFGAVFFLGGAGAMLDFPKFDACIQELVNTIYYKNNGIIATIGHGLAALCGEKVRNQNGEPFLKNLQVTGATKEEEHSLGKRCCLAAGLCNFFALFQGWMNFFQPPWKRCAMTWVPSSMPSQSSHRMSLSLSAW